MAIRNVNCGWLGKTRMLPKWSLISFYSFLYPIHKVKYILSIKFFFVVPIKICSWHLTYYIKLTVRNSFHIKVNCVVDPYKILIKYNHLYSVTIFVYCNLTIHLLEYLVFPSPFSHSNSGEQTSLHINNSLNFSHLQLLRLKSTNFLGFWYTAPKYWWSISPYNFHRRHCTSGQLTKGLSASTVISDNF